jgi:hypothetical protein
MGLPWVRLDSAFARNPKIIELAQQKRWQAITAYVSSLGYSGEHGLAGFVPSACLPWIHATPAIARHLVQARLWHPVTGGWEINDWREYQPTNEEAERRRKRAKDAASVRWAKANGQATITELAARK